MLIVHCLECGSENVGLDCTEKYLVCNDCKERKYIRDLDIGFIEDKWIEIGRLRAISPIETQEIADIEWLCPKCKSKVGDCVNVDNFCSKCGQKLLFN